MVYKLKKSLMLDGVQISELNLDLDNFTGDDVKAAEQAFKTLYRGEMVPSIYLDSRYHEIIIGRVSGVNPQDLGKLFAPDYVGVCMAVQNFLLDVGSGGTTKAA